MDKFNSSSIDAKIWAKEFMRLYNENIMKQNVLWIDESLMLSWFANTIMAGYDEAKRRYEGKSEVMGREELIKIISPYFNDIVIDLNIYHKGDYFREKIGQIADAILNKIPATKCPVCLGSGLYWNEYYGKDMECPKCNGTGKIPKDK